ncbi:MAG: hypothetical protein GY870_04665 [archaeon]|nr:hypothetical protein [archaeon]
MSEEIKKINRNDISEEVRYVVECPYCKSLTDMDDYHENAEDGFCEHCDKEFEIED